MSKGYPTLGSDDSYPHLETLLPEDACVICKKRERATPESLCRRCAAALQSPAP